MFLPALQCCPKLHSATAFAGATDRNVFGGKSSSMLPGVTQIAVAVLHTMLPSKPQDGFQALEQTPERRNSVAERLVAAWAAADSGKAAEQGQLQQRSAAAASKAAVEKKQEEVDEEYEQELQLLRQEKEEVRYCLFLVCRASPAVKAGVVLLSRQVLCLWSSEIYRFLCMFL